MLHQTKRVAMEQYEKILTQQLTGDAILTAIVILLFIAISIALYVDWKKHPKGEEKSVIIVTFILVTCILVGSSIFGLSAVFKIKKIWIIRITSSTAESIHWRNLPKEVSSAISTPGMNA